MEVLYTNAYWGIRQPNLKLLRLTGCTMLQFITHPDHLGVARCILACLDVIDVPVV